MDKLRKMGCCKKKHGESYESSRGWNNYHLPYPVLTMDDMPEFKNRLYKAITTNQVFMIYNDRKYSREYAKLTIRVTESTSLTRVIHDA